MRNPGCEVEVRPGRDGEVVVRVAGEIDLATAPLVHETLADGPLLAAPRLVVDVGGVTFLSAAGVRVLLEVNDRLHAHGGRLVLRDPGPLVQRVLRAADVVDLVAIEFSGHDGTRPAGEPAH